VAEIYRYRTAVDQAMEALIAGVSEAQWERIKSLAVLGLNHEQQHQELLYTDLQHLFAMNPLRPICRDLPAPPAGDAPALVWREFAGGVHWIGHPGKGFAYDNEGPAHRQWLEDFALASRPVTNGE
jgi:formylglycine-generating enzyme required for sulfatase activity